MTAPNHSSLSSVCRGIADFVKDEIDFGDASVDVVIGNPENAEPSNQGNNNNHQINLFFYKFQPSGFQPDVMPGENWLLRCHCMITPFAVDEDNKSAGEIDLRLLGEVMRLFHEQPVQSMDIDDDGNTQTFQIQVVNQPLELEELNQLWGTQGDVIYRPSVVYEIDLVPVIPLEKTVESPLVGAWGVDIHGNTDDARYAEGSGNIVVPMVQLQTVNTNIESWAPVVSFVHNSACADVLSFELGSTELSAFQRQVWVAGEVGADVDFYWEVWDSDNGWQTLPVVDSTTIPSSEIDPDNIDNGALFTLTAPSYSDDSGTVNVLEVAGQAVLYAVRTYKRAAEGDSGPDYTARSNPLLISLYEAS